MNQRVTDLTGMDPITVHTTTGVQAIQTDTARDDFGGQTLEEERTGLVISRGCLWG